MLGREEPVFWRAPRTQATPATSAAFESLWDRCNESIYRALLGQSSTVAQGENGARAADEVRERTLDMLIESDAGLIAEVLQEQLVDVIQAKRAGGRELVEVSYSWERETPPLERAEVFVKATAAGIEFDFDRAREELGLEPPSPEQLAEKQARADAMAAALAGAAGTQQPGDEDDEDEDDEEPPVAAARRHRRAVALRAVASGDQDALDQVAERAAARTSARLAGDVGAAVRGAVPSGMTQPEADQAIQRALSVATVSPIAGAIERAILAAAYNGRSNAQAWLKRHRGRRA